MGSLQPEKLSSSLASPTGKHNCCGHYGPKLNRSKIPKIAHFFIATKSNCLYLWRWCKARYILLARPSMNWHARYTGMQVTIITGKWSATNCRNWTITLFVNGAPDKNARWQKNVVRGRFLPLLLPTFLSSFLSLFFSLSLCHCLVLLWIMLARQPVDKLPLAFHAEMLQPTTADQTGFAQMRI
jgi:hypothetical protein